MEYRADPAGRSQTIRDPRDAWRSGLLLAALLLWRPAGIFSQTTPEIAVEVSASDSDGRAVPGVRVELHSAQGALFSASTDAKGHVALRLPAAGRYQLSATKQGFEPLRRELDLFPGPPAGVDLTLIPSLGRRDSIEVSAPVDAVPQAASAPAQIHAQEAKELPSRPATVADALPLTPGVVREPGGGLDISGAGEHRSALLVNSADVTDPASGQFGLTVPIDSVDVLSVFQTPFLAEYGRFTAGLVTVETRRGGDQWKWELNDPLPEFRIRSWHLRGLKDATPRLNFEGPVIAHKLYISEGAEYEIRKTAVFTLPFPHNQRREEGVNTFTQLDWVRSAKEIVTATLHVAPQRMGFVNMDYFNPEPTTPDASTHNYTGTIGEHLTLHGGMLENTISVSRFDVGVWGHGDEDLVITPDGNRGNYYAQRDRNATRYSGSSSYTFPTLNRAGSHTVKVGSYFASSSEQGEVDAHPIDILDAQDRAIERITFRRNESFDISDVEYAFYGQDHWIISPRFAFDTGVRTESQQIAHAFRMAPRVGLAWNPFASLGTTVRAGFGYFYDRVPLNVYCFNRFPDEVITTYDAATGEITSGPTLYLNTLGQVRVKHPFVFQRPIDGNFSPQSVTWSVQVEQPVSRNLKLRAAYMQNGASDLVILNPVPPDAESTTGAYLLSGLGQSHYHQFEMTARVRVGEGRELFFSYVRSRSRGDLNDFSQFLGKFPAPIIRPNQYGNLPADLPNRFISWGVVQFPKRFQIAPVIEYRSGFPYLITDAAQNYVGEPNRARFPNFLSIDSRFSKDIQVNPKYAVRLSISGFNLTNHFNPEAVHWNVDDPVFGYFFGHRGRRFTADFDVLF